MNKILEEFMGKEVIVSTLSGSEIGTLEKITDGGILLRLKDGNSVAAVNSELIVKIEEYPSKKKAKNNQ